ncbi:hypothetical protein FO519_002395 [Halicephalobus sp. NKZ332]|nr:hypothetical protein FO519_002395 [Halicephalobus sp. NKZ332]
MNFCSLLIISTFGIGVAYLDTYYCGEGPLSKTLSYLTTYSCGTDLINDCCFAHDSCYEWNLWTPYIVSCDDVFANCTYDAYIKNNQTFCANLIYYTHGKLMVDLGSVFRSLNGYGFGKK